MTKNKTNENTLEALAMTKTDLLDYLNSQITIHNSSITEKETYKSNIDAAITQQENSITEFNNLKSTADDDIAAINLKITELADYITFVENNFVN